jgi:extracellular factor (EF) 3-hydroxypalmitic acid methyl ester biosynthesis protein
MDSQASVNGAPKDCWVTFDNGQGPELGKLLRITRHVAVFEVYNPCHDLQMSQVLPDLKVVLNQQTIYSGRAVIRNLVHTGVCTVSEVSLADEWAEGDLPCLSANELRDRFRAFLEGWQGVYRIRPEFKVVVADLHSFLADLKLWLDQIDLGIRTRPSAEASAMVTQVMEQLEISAVPAINGMHERFEQIADRLEPDLRPAHQHFARRHLHPLYLCSPFGFRAYQKPLGYAGDYEVVNMIMRNPYEGDTLFAKTMNLWLLRQYPSQAHRNRIRYLEERLGEEALRRRMQGKPARILNLGCGPAHEIQHFIRDNPLADATEFTLVDMSEETLDFARRVLGEARQRAGRRTVLVTQRKSVLQLLRESAKAPSNGGGSAYDFIYCAGLFDYLTDRTCRQLLGLLRGHLAPGGLLVATNVDDCRPFRHMLEFLLDWHLTYRNGAALRELMPEDAPPDDCRIRSDDTGTNVFLEVRKPADR